MSRSKLLQSPFFPVPTLALNFSESSAQRLRALKASSGCHVIGRRAACANNNKSFAGCRCCSLLIVHVFGLCEQRCKLWTGSPPESNVQPSSYALTGLLGGGQRFFNSFLLRPLKIGRYPRNYVQYSQSSQGSSSQIIKSECVSLPLTKAHENRQRASPKNRCCSQ